MIKKLINYITLQYITLNYIKLKNNTINEMINEIK